MSDSGIHRGNSDAVYTQLGFVSEVFSEIFNLLEQYGPTWYLEEHHNRVVSALHALEKSRQLAKREAARAKKAAG